MMDLCGVIFHHFSILYLKFPYICHGALFFKKIKNLVIKLFILIFVIQTNNICQNLQ
jgi:hypothetical protein